MRYDYLVLLSLFTMDTTELERRPVLLPAIAKSKVATILVLNGDSSIAAGAQWPSVLGRA